MSQQSASEFGDRMILRAPRESLVLVCVCVCLELRYGWLDGERAALESPSWRLTKARPFHLGARAEKSEQRLLFMLSRARPGRAGPGHGLAGRRRPGGRRRIIVVVRTTNLRGAVYQDGQLLAAAPD